MGEIGSRVLMELRMWWNLNLRFEKKYNMHSCRHTCFELFCCCRLINPSCLLQPILKAIHDAIIGADGAGNATSPPRTMLRAPCLDTPKKKKLAFVPDQHQDRVDVAFLACQLLEEKVVKLGTMMQTVHKLGSSAFITK